MCFSKPSLPDTAAQAAADEQKREAQISQGTALVNQNFGKFTPQYYASVGDAYKGYYQPQLDAQARDARRATALRFADNPNSSASARVQGSLEGDYATKAAGIASGAIDAENQARQQVEGERGSLLNLVNAGSSLDSVAAQSANFANAYNPPATYSPLGDAFSKYTNQLGIYNNASQNGYQIPSFFQRNIDFLRGNSGNGSARNVGGGP